MDWIYLLVLVTIIILTLVKEFKSTHSKESVNYFNSVSKETSNFSVHETKEYTNGK